MDGAGDALTAQERKDIRVLLEFMRSGNLARSGKSKLVDVCDYPKLDEAFKEYINQSFGFAANLEKVQTLAGSLDRQLDEAAKDLQAAIYEFKKPIESALAPLRMGNGEPPTGFPSLDPKTLKVNYSTLNLCMYRFHVASLRLASKVSQNEERSYFNSIHAEIPALVGTSSHTIVLEVSSTLHKAHARMHDAMDEILTAFTKKHESVRNDLQALTAIAAFFSSITATTLSVSYNGPATPTARTTNVLWFSSLLFSVASAFSSMLGLSWHGASGWGPKYEISGNLSLAKNKQVQFEHAFMFEYRKLNGENWIYPLIMTFPLVTLAFSGVLFTIGLCTFSFSFGEGQAPSIVITTLAALLLAMIIMITVGYNFHRESVKAYQSNALAKALMFPAAGYFEVPSIDNETLPYTRDGGIS